MAHYTVVSGELKLPITASAKLLNENNEYNTVYYNNFSQKLLADGVSNRERDVIRLLALNFSSKQIAEKLGISPNTVATHLFLHAPDGDVRFVNLSEFLKKHLGQDMEQTMIWITPEIATGKIAEKLNISPNTVDTHRRNILKKLNVSSTGELIGMLKTSKKFFY